jgi:Tol biopolymer transport system component
MSRPEDRMRRAADAASGSVPTTGVFDRVSRRKRRFAIRRRANVALLSVAVVAGTLFGTTVLNDTFRPASGGGFVAFIRFLRSCPAHPNVEGPMEVFAVDVATGDERRVGHLGAWPNGDIPFELAPEFTPDGTRFVWVDRYRDSIYVTDVRRGETTKLVALDDVVASLPSSLGIPGFVADVDATTIRPRISPDGTTIVFSVPGGDAIDDRTTQTLDDASSIFAVDIAGASPPVLLTTGHLPTWTNDGRIAFVRTSTTAAVERVGGGVSIDDAPLSTTFHLMDRDGTHDEQVYEAPADTEIASADWSPDGTHVAAAVTMHGNTDIYVVDLDTHVPTRLTSDPAEDTSPTWSPDGSFIAFHTGRYGSFEGHAEIAMVPAAGGDVIRLTHDDCWQDTDPTWVDDPTTVAALPVWTPPALPDLGERGAAHAGDILVSAGVDGVFDIYALDPETGGVTNLTADLIEQGTPAWSPDRSEIAFAAAEDKPFNLDIYVMEADGSGVRRLTSAPSGDARPTWSPDGAKIAYESDDGVWVVNADGSDAHHLAGSSCGGGCYPSWSPDGQSIAYAQVGSGLFAVAADGSTTREILSGSDAYDPEWSPDGATLVYACGTHICAVDADGSGSHALTGDDPGSYEREPDWSPDGSQIVFMTDEGRDRSMGVWIMNADGSDARELELDPSIPIEIVRQPNW